VGDIICEVDGKSIKGMKPEAVAALMAGELGSYVVIKSVSGVVARIKRDISAGQKSP
jgi:C-terminal processing protease CtpA/Prc